MVNIRSFLLLLAISVQFSIQAEPITKAVTCPWSYKSLGMSIDSKYPRISTSWFNTLQPNFGGFVAYDPMNDGACIGQGKYLQIDFNRTASVCQIWLQSTTGYRVTVVDFKFFAEGDDTTEMILKQGYAFGFSTVTMRQAYNLDAITNMTKLRIYPITTDKIACMRVDVRECPMNSTLTACALNGKSVGLLTHAPMSSMLSDDLISTNDFDTSTLRRVRMNLGDEGACLRAGATYFQIDFNMTRNIYKVVVQGTSVSLATKLQFKYLTMGSFMETDLWNATVSLTDAYSSDTVIFPQITQMSKLRVYIREWQPTAAKACIRMDVYTCSDITMATCLLNSVSVGLATHAIYPRISVEQISTNADTSMTDQEPMLNWDLGNIRFMNYRGMCLTGLNYIDITFPGYVALSGVKIQGGLGPDGKSSTVAQLSSVLLSLSYADPNDNWNVKMANKPSGGLAINYAGDGTLMMFPAFSTYAIRVQAVNAPLDRLTCFRMDPIGCYESDWPLGLGVDLMYIATSQISSSKVGAVNLDNVRYGSAVPYSVGVGESIIVKFDVPTTVTGLLFQTSPTLALTTFDVSAMSVGDTQLNVVASSLAVSFVADPTKSLVVLLEALTMVQQIAIAPAAAADIRMELMGSRPAQMNPSCLGAPSGAMGISYEIAKIGPDKFTAGSLNGTGMAYGTPPTVLVRLNDPTLVSADQPESRLGFCPMSNNLTNATGSIFIGVMFDDVVRITTVTIQAVSDSTKVVKQFKVRYRYMGVWFWVMDANNISPKIFATQDLGLAGPYETQNFDVGAVYTDQVALVVTDPVDYCIRYDLLGCYLGSTPDLTLTVTARFAFADGADITAMCLSSYEMAMSVQVDIKIADWMHTCDYLGGARLQFSAEIKASLPSDLYIGIKIKVSAGQYTGLCADRLLSLIVAWNITTLTTLNPMCGNISKTGPLTLQTKSFTCPDGSALSIQADGTTACMRLTNGVSACGPFSVAPSVVQNYGLNFRANMLLGDMILTTATAADCQKKAMETSLSSFYFTSAAAVDNCFMTSVVANRDYYFVDQSLMVLQNATSTPITANDTLVQRKCANDDIQPAAIFIVDTVVYQITGLDLCVFNTTSDLASIKAKFFDNAQMQLTTFFNMCNLKGASAQFTNRSAVFTSVAGGINIYFSKTTMVSAMSGLTMSAGLTACAGAITWTYPNFDTGLLCDEITHQAVVVANSSSKTTSYGCDDGWLLGPNGMFCFRNSSWGYEVKQGYCPLPPECDSQLESVYHCSLQCLYTNSCLGYVYSIAGKSCQLMQNVICEEFYPNIGALYFRKITGACQSLSATVIADRTTFDNLILGSLIGDRQQLNMLCSDGMLAKFMKSTEVIGEICQSDEVMRYNVTGLTSLQYYYMFCQAVPVIPEFPGPDLQLVTLGNRQYKYVSDQMSFWAAEQYCKDQMGGHLLSIMSQAEQDFIVNLLMKYPLTENFWIGLYNINIAANWTDAAQVTFLGTPKVFNNVENSCGYLHKNGAVYEWWDDDCDTNEFAFICYRNTPTGTCDIQSITSILINIQMTFKASLLNPTDLKYFCQNYVANVVNVVVAFFANTSNGCDAVRKFVVIEQLQFMYKQILAVCGPMPGDGDRTAEECDMDGMSMCLQNWGMYGIAGFFNNTSPTTRDYCSHQADLLSCIDLSSQKCSTTDKLVGQAYKAYYTFTAQGMCGQQTIACSESTAVLSLRATLKSITVNALYSRGSNDELCNVTMRSAILDATALLAATACTGDQISRLQATLTAASTALDMFCKMAPVTVYNDFRWMSWMTYQYKIFMARTTFWMAEQRCISEGGNLVSILNAGEEQFVITMLGMQMGMQMQMQMQMQTSPDVWIGMYDLWTGAKWTDGSMAAFNGTNQNFNDSTTQCVRLRMNGTYQWTVNDCNMAAAFVCKRPTQTVQQEYCDEQSAMNCVVGVVDVFMNGFLAGNNGFYTICNFELLAIKCVQSYIKKCSGPTQQRFMNAFDWFWILIGGANCTFRKDVRCQKDDFVLSYEYLNTMALNVNVTVKDRCMAVEMMKTNMASFVANMSLITCTDYQQFSIDTKYKQLLYFMTTICDTCVNSNYVTMMGATMLDYNYNASLICMDDRRMQLRLQTRSITTDMSAMCDANALMRLSSMAMYIYQSLDMLCNDTAKRVTLMNQFCGIQDKACNVDATFNIGLGLTVTNSKECHTKCRLDPTCVAFFYQNTRCTLQKYLCSEMELTDAVGGFYFYRDNMMQSCRPPGASFCARPGMDCAGADLVSSVQPSMYSCRQQCLNQVGCMTFQYNTLTKMCRLVAMICSTAQLTRADPAMTGYYKLGANEACATSSIDVTRVVKFCSYNGYDCPGSALGSFETMMNMSACRTKCATNVLCMGIVWEMRSPTEFRCWMKSSVCGAAQMMMNANMTFQAIIGSEVMCGGQIGMNYKCNVDMARMCVNNATTRLFAQVATGQIVYLNSACYGFASVRMCVMDNIRNCSYRDQSTLSAALNTYSRLMSSFCVYPMQPMSCNMMGAKMCLSDLLDVRTRFRDNVTAIWDLSGTCGFIYSQTKCITMSLMYCNKDAEYMSVYASASMVSFYFKTFCNTLVALDCTATTSFSCLLTYTQSVTAVQLSVTPQTMPYCLVMQNTTVGTCLSEIAITCPNPYMRAQSILAVASQTLIQMCMKPVCREVKVADIVLVIDESGSVGSDNYDKQIAFVRVMAENLDIGLDKIRLGIQEFSTRVNDRFYLKAAVDQTAVLKYVDNMDYDGGSTNTDAALKDVTDNFFTTINGARTGVPKIVIILTDGQSRSPKKTMAEAKRLKDTGAQIFVLGIGANVDSDELASMASVPTDQFVYSVTSFDVLKSLPLKVLSDAFCQGTGQTNPYLTTEIRECQESEASQCITDWSSSMFRAVFLNDDVVLAQTCMNIVSTTQCLQTKLLNCTGPTRYRVATAMWGVRQSFYQVCSSLIIDTDVWGKYNDSCDGNFTKVQNCIMVFDSMVKETKAENYTSLCGNMTATISCVSDNVAACPALEQFYWKARLQFAYYPLYVSQSCPEPNPNPPVSGNQCAQAEGTMLITQLSTLSLQAAITGNYKATCDLWINNAAKMNSTMAQCTDAQNRDNMVKYQSIVISLSTACNIQDGGVGVVVVINVGCNLTMVLDCLTSFTYDLTAILNGDATALKAGCASLTATLTCARSHYVNCSAVAMVSVDAAMKVFTDGLNKALVCTDDVYVPSVNRNCKLTAARTELDTLKRTISIDNGTSVCGTLDAVLARLKTNLIDCPSNDSMTILAEFDSINKSLALTCSTVYSCMSDRTQITMYPGDTSMVKFWFQGNPIRAKCIGLTNCTVKIRYALQNKEDGYRCLGVTSPTGYSWLPQGVFGTVYAGPSCGIDVNAINMASPFAVPLYARWYNKNTKDQVRLLKFYTQVYQNGAFVNEDECQLVQVTFKRDEKRQNNLKFCTLYGDPHAKSFNNIGYNCYEQNHYQLYQHNVLPYEVQSYFAPCNPNWPHSCICLISVRCGGLAVTLNRCKTNYDPKKKCLANCANDKGATLTKGTIINAYLNGDACPGLRIYYEKATKEYDIVFPNGMEVNLGEIEGAFNFKLKPTLDDYGQTKGLCGGLTDDDKATDWVLSNGTVFDMKTLTAERRPFAFTDSYVLADSDQFYMGRVPKYTLPPNTVKQYCLCSTTLNTTSLCGDYIKADDCYKRQGAMTDLTDKIIKNAITVTPDATQQQQRKKRDVPQNPLPNNSTRPADPVFKAPWTMDTATAYCEAARDNISILAQCATQFGVNVQSAVDTCVEDIKITSDGPTSAAMSMYQAVKQCKDTVAQAPDDPNNLTANDAFLAQVQTALCPNDCSNHGTCIKGTCTCIAGWGDVDCSLDLTQPPGIVSVGIDGTCNPSTQDCTMIGITANNINSQANPQCRVQELQVTPTGSTAYGPVLIMNATILNDAQLICQVNKSTTYTVGVSNDGSVYSPTYLYLVYDPRCQTCNDTSASTTCSQKAGTCVVDSLCYNDGDASNMDNCLVCDATRNQTSLKVRETEPCLTKYGLNDTPGGSRGLGRTEIIIIACAGALVGLGLIVLIVVKCMQSRNNKRRAPNATPANGDRKTIHRSQPEIQYSFDGPQEAVAEPHAGV